MACLSATALSGCLSVPIEELQPTADQETIDTAIEHLSDIKGMTITENGVIYYVESLPGNSRWSTAHISELSYRYSCQDLRWFVDRGMIVRMRFQGNSGARPKIMTLSAVRRKFQRTYMNLNSRLLIISH